MVVKHRSSNTRKISRPSTPLRSQLRAGGTAEREETFFLCNTASTFSHFRFPPTNWMWWAFPPLVKSMFQHLAGVFRRWLPFPDNPGRGKPFEQCFWQAAVGGSRQSPPHHSLVEEEHIPGHIPGTNYRQFLGQGSPRQARDAHQCHKALGILRMGYRRDDGILPFMLSTCFRFARG